MLDDLIPLSQTFLRIRNRDFKRYFLRDHPLANRFAIFEVGGKNKDAGQIKEIEKCLAGIGQYRDWSRQANTALAVWFHLLTGTVATGCDQIGA